MKNKFLLISCGLINVVNDGYDEMSSEEQRRMVGLSRGLRKDDTNRLGLALVFLEEKIAPAGIPNQFKI